MANEISVASPSREILTNFSGHPWPLNRV